MKNILVSSCLLGIGCRFDGKSKAKKAVLDLLKNENIQLIPFCPEQYGGLPIPRVPSEIKGDKVFSREGKDVTAQYEKGAREALRVTKMFHCQAAVLKDRSPSCGHDQVYDGTFTKTLVPGDGIATRLLKENGIPVFGESDVLSGKFDEWLENNFQGDDTMKETLKDLKERRACRKYLPEQIKDEELNAILEAGTYAPTGMGKQSPYIVVVQDKEMIAKLSKMNAAVVNMPIDPFYGAPTVLIVFADTQMPTYLYDGSLVMGNLMNAAQAVGVDSCYIFRAKEVFASEEGKALMKEWGVPESCEGIGNCILGYRAEGGVKDPAPRKEGYIIRA